MPFESQVLRRLENIERLLHLVLHKENLIMSAQTDALDRAEEAARVNNDADSAAETLLISLSKMIADLKTGTSDPALIARIDALATGIQERASRLVTAVNTTQAAVTPPTPPTQPAAPQTSSNVSGSKSSRDL